VSETIVIVCAFLRQPLQQRVVEEIYKREITRKYFISRVTLPTFPKDNQKTIVSDSFQ
jgi:hypothetical protein